MFPSKDGAPAGSRHFDPVIPGQSLPGKERLLIGTPHGRDFTPEYLVSLFGTYKELASRVNIDITFIEGLYIHSNRSLILKQAVTLGPFDYVLMIDTDMQWSPEDVAALMDLRADVATGLYCMRFAPFNPVVYRVDSERFTQFEHAEVPREPFECAAAGAGLLLISRPVVEWAMARETIDEIGPPFDPVRGIYREEKATCMGGEDISFFWRLAKTDFKLVCHPDVRPTHIGYGAVEFKWPEQPIGPTIDLSGKRPLDVGGPTLTKPGQKSLVIAPDPAGAGGGEI